MSNIINNEGVCINLTSSIHHPVIKQNVKDFEVAFGLAIIITSFIGAILLYHFKNKYLYLQERSMFSQIFLLTGCIICFIVVSYRDVYVGRGNFPCVGLTVLNQLIILFVSGPIFANFMMYLYKLRLQREDVVNRVRYDKKKLNSPIARVFSFNTEEHETKTESSGNINYKLAFDNFCSQLYDFAAIWKHKDDHSDMLDPSDHNDDALSVVSAGDKNVSNTTSTKKVGDENRSVTKRRIKVIKKTIFSQKTVQNYLLPLCFSLFNALPFLLIAIFRVFLDPLYANNCNGCYLNYIDIVASLIGATFNSVYILVVLYIARNEPDPVGMRREFLLCMFIGTPLAVISWILILVDPNFLERQGETVWQLMQISACIACSIFTSYFQIGIAMYQRYTILSSDNIALDLDSMLADYQVRKILLRHCANELSSENILFLLDANDWKSSKANGATRQYIMRELSKICESYIIRSGNTPVNISSKTVDNVLRNVEMLRENPESQIEMDLLDGAIRECKEIVIYDTLPRLRKTQMYEKEIVSTGLIDRIVSKGFIKTHQITTLPIQKVAEDKAGR